MGAKRKMPAPENIETICRLYREGNRLETIAGATGEPRTVVRRVLQEAGIWQKGKRCDSLAEEAIAQILARYEAGESSSTIAASLGVHHPTVTRWIKRRGVIRTRSEAFTEYEHRKNAFSLPLSPEGLYWLGFILTDGCVDGLNDTEGRQPRLRFYLQAGDRAAVEGLRSYLGYTGPIPLETGERNHCGIELRSREVVADLIRLGVTPAKSFTVKAHPAVVNECDFWRGVIDGNGHLERLPKIGLTTASFLLADQYTDFLCDRGLQYSVSKTSRDGRPLCMQILVLGDRARHLAKSLYGKGGPSLARKQAIADDIMSQTMTGRNRYKRQQE